MDISGTTHNFTVSNAVFKNFVDLENLTNAAILFDHDDFTWGGDCSHGGTNGLFTMHYASSQFSGITLQYSKLGNTDCDGVHTGIGLNILNNEFVNFCEGSSPNHTDNIQFEGAVGGRVAGNYVHEPMSGCESQGITSYDGGTRGVLVEDNVVDIPRADGIEWYADVNSIIRHNTVAFRSHGCPYNLDCGGIAVDCKQSEYNCPNGAGYGTQVYDNIAYINVGDGATTARNDHNHNGTDVTFVGGATPPSGGFASFAQYLLSATSAGRGAADDGTNLGIWGAA
jgi:hypothetical protein